MLLVGDDFELDKPIGDMQLKEEIEQQLKSLVGMEAAHSWFDKLKEKVEYVYKTNDLAVLTQCLNLVISGNPGTGKTSFSEILCKFMAAYGLIKKPTFVCKNATTDLKELGPKAVEEAVKEAMGGCLMIDEMHALAATGQGIGSKGDKRSQV
jgi:DNA replication protein DnaC